MMHKTIRKIHLLFFSIISFSSVMGQSSSNYLYRICVDENCELGTPTGYVNQLGDTIIPLGKYQYCYTDTLKHFAIVLDLGGRCLGIDQKDSVLFSLVWFDNGPDRFSNGLIRIVQEGRIGFVNRKGEVVIPPFYSWAEPFIKGMSKASFYSEIESNDEYSSIDYQSWYYIDTLGNRVSSLDIIQKKVDSLCYVEHIASMGLAVPAKTSAGMDTIVYYC